MEKFSLDTFLAFFSINEKKKLKLVTFKIRPFFIQNSKYLFKYCSIA